MLFLGLGNAKGVSTKPLYLIYIKRNLKKNRVTISVVERFNTLLKIHIFTYEWDKPLLPTFNAEEEVEAWA